MELLIIGAAGFIGSAALSLFSGKYNVTGADLSGDPKKNILKCEHFDKIKMLIIKNKFDIIINCAGSSNISQSFKEPGRDFELNTVLVQNLLETIMAFSPGTKVINLSSAAVYGNPQILPVKENDPKKPMSPYGLNKLLSEQLISGYAEFNGLKTLGVRIFSAYGPGLKRQFFYDLYSKFILSPRVINLSGTGNESRDFVFISDITDALDVLIQKGKFNGDIYNVASEQESFIRPTAQLFAGICGYTGEINFTQEKFNGYPLNWKADISKLKSLGFSPKTNIDDGLKLYFNWIKNN